MEDSIQKKFEEINSADDIKRAFITYLQASINIDRYQDKKFYIYMIAEPELYKQLFSWEIESEKDTGEYISQREPIVRFFWSKHWPENEWYAGVHLESEEKLNYEYYPYAINTHKPSKEERAEYKALRKKAGCNLAGGCVLNKCGMPPIDCKKCPYVTGEKKLDLEDENIKQLIQSRKSKDGYWLF